MPRNKSKLKNTSTEWKDLIERNDSKSLALFAGIIRRDFSLVYKQACFLNLSLSFLERVLKIVGSAPSEPNLILDAVLRWLNYNWKERFANAPILISACVSFKRTVDFSSVDRLKSLKKILTRPRGSIAQERVTAWILDKILGPKSQIYGVSSCDDASFTSAQDGGSDKNLSENFSASESSKSSILCNSDPFGQESIYCIFSISDHRYDLKIFDLAAEVFVAANAIELEAQEHVFGAITYRKRPFIVTTKTCDSAISHLRLRPLRQHGYFMPQILNLDVPSGLPFQHISSSFTVSTHDNILCISSFSIRSSELTHIMLYDLSILCQWDPMRISLACKKLWCKEDWAACAQNIISPTVAITSSALFVFGRIVKDQSEFYAGLKLHLFGEGSRVYKPIESLTHVAHLSRTPTIISVNDCIFAVSGRENLKTCSGFTRLLTDSLSEYVDLASSLTQELPPLMYARSNPIVLQIGKNTDNKALLVIGGVNAKGEMVKRAEVFRFDVKLVDGSKQFCQNDGWMDYGVFDDVCPTFATVA